MLQIHLHPRRVLQQSDDLSLRTLQTRTQTLTDPTSQQVHLVLQVRPATFSFLSFSHNDIIVLLSLRIDVHTLVFFHLTFGIVIIVAIRIYVFKLLLLFLDRHHLTLAPAAIVDDDSRAAAGATGAARTSPSVCDHSLDFTAFVQVVAICDALAKSAARAAHGDGSGCACAIARWRVSA